MQEYIKIAWHLSRAKRKRLVQKHPIGFQVLGKNLTPKAKIITYFTICTFRQFPFWGKYPKIFH